LWREGAFLSQLRRASRSGQSESEAETAFHSKTALSWISVG
jgi:hypothetical protein